MVTYQRIVCYNETMPHKDVHDRREYQKKYQREWRKNNPDKVKEIISRWYWQNRDAKISKTVQSNKRRYHELRIITLERYGGKCACCGENTYEFLTIDHINNDGKNERKIMNNYAGRIYGYLANAEYQPKKYQILCWNCNLAKEKYGLCPHQRKES